MLLTPTVYSNGGSDGPNHQELQILGFAMIYFKAGFKCPSLVLLTITKKNLNLDYTIL